MSTDIKRFREEYEDVRVVQEFARIQGGYDLMQPKWDGIWCRVSIANGEAIATTREGTVLENFQVEAMDCEIIGELIGRTPWAANRPENFIAFDLLEYGRSDLRHFHYRERLGLLQNIFPKEHAFFTSVVRTLPIDGARNFWQGQVMAGEQFEGLVYRKSQAAFGEAVILREKRIVRKVSRQNLQN